MPRERHRAAGAEHRLAAVAAGEKRVVAAAVEKQDRLFAARQRLVHFFGEQCAEGRQIAAERIFAHIVDVDLREARVAVAFGQLDERILPASRLVVAFDRGGRRGKQQKPFCPPDAERGNVARVVLRAHVRLVGVFLLLVDDDHAEVRQRGEHRAARADDEIDFARGNAAVGVMPLPRRERGMQHRHPFAVKRAEKRHGLRGQRDLGHKHDHLPPVRAHAVDHRLHHAGLARAGHAVEQGAVRALRGVKCAQAVICGSLVRAELVLPPFVDLQVGIRIAVDGLGAELDKPRCTQRLQLGAACSALCKGVGSLGKVRADRRIKRALLFAAQHPCGHSRAADIDHLLFGGAFQRGERRGQRPHRVARGAERVFLQKIADRQLLFRERNQPVDIENVLGARAVGLVLHACDQRHMPPVCPRKGDVHEGAAFDQPREVRGNAVVKRAVERGRRIQQTDACILCHAPTSVFSASSVLSWISCCRD